MVIILVLKIEIILFWKINCVYVCQCVCLCVYACACVHVSVFPDSRIRTKEWKIQRRKLWLHLREKFSNDVSPLPVE